MIVVVIDRSGRVRDVLAAGQSRYLEDAETALLVDETTTTITVGAKLGALSETDRERKRVQPDSARRVTGSGSALATDDDHADLYPLYGEVAVDPDAMCHEDLVARATALSITTTGKTDQELRDAIATDQDFYEVL